MFQYVAGAHQHLDLLRHVNLIRIPHLPFWARLYRDIINRSRTPNAIFRRQGWLAAAAAATVVVVVVAVVTAARRLPMELVTDLREPHCSHAHKLIENGEFKFQLDCIDHGFD